MRRPKIRSCTSTPRRFRRQPHIDLSPAVCTSLLVDRWLGGRARKWALVGAFGDSLLDDARQLAERSGLDGEQSRVLEQLGVRLNYNAYGESLSDLHVVPT